MYKSNMAQRLFLIDGNNIFYRNYFAPFKPLNAPCTHCGNTGEVAGPGGVTRCQVCNGTGFEPTKAVWLSVKQLFALAKAHKPAYLAVAFDGPASALHRRKLYPDYKAGRKEKEPGFTAQFARFQQILDLLGIYRAARRGHEADDIIATLAGRWPTPVIVVSGDKDLRQLCCRKNVAVLLPGAGHFISRYNAGERWGIKTAQIHELLTLAGDKTDNVPGVPGIAEKTAAKLLRRYGKIKHLLTAARAGQLTPALTENLLAAYKSKALHRAYRLTRLADNVPGLPKDLEKLAFRLDVEKALPVFQQLCFKPFWEE